VGAVAPAPSPPARIPQAPAGVCVLPSGGGTALGNQPAPPPAPAVVKKAEAKKATNAAVRQKSAKTTERSTHQIATASKLLNNRDLLKTEVVKCFKKVDGGAQTIDIHGLRDLETLLASAIGLPREVFGNIATDYNRFDFEGSGRLNANEVYKLVKHHLWQYLKASGSVQQVDLPHKTLDQAGYSVTRNIGKGTQATVKLAMDSAGRERCIKCYKKGQMTVGGLAELKEEFETMRRLSCERLAHAFEIFQDTQFYYMVNEVYHGGDLGSLKARAIAQGVTLNERYWRCIFSQCFEALAFLHNNAMMHCDVKEPNIMLRTRNLTVPEVVFIDFGLARAMAAESNGRIEGTPGYLPPEVWDTGLWFPGGDVFSMGVACMQVLVDKVPDIVTGKGGGLFLEGCFNLKEVERATKTRTPPWHLLPQDMPGLLPLVQQLLQKELARRPRAPQVLQNPWFTSGPVTTIHRPERARQKAAPEAESHPLGTTGISWDFYNSVR